MAKFSWKGKPGSVTTSFLHAVAPFADLWHKSIKCLPPREDAESTAADLYTSPQIVQFKEAAWMSYDNAPCGVAEGLGEAAKEGTRRLPNAEDVPSGPGL